MQQNLTLNPSPKGEGLAPSPFEEGFSDKDFLKNMVNITLEFYQ